MTTPEIDFRAAREWSEAWATWDALIPSGNTARCYLAMAELIREMADATDEYIRAVSSEDLTARCDAYKKLCRLRARAKEMTDG